MIVVVVNAAMLVALLSDDFAIRYVADNSSRGHADVLQGAVPVGGR